MQQTFPTLHTFSTLSPIPKFCSWVGKGNSTASEAIIADVVNAILKHKPELLEGVNKMDNAAVLKTLSVVLNDERLEWANDKSFSQTLREPVSAP